MRLMGVFETTGSDAAEYARDTKVIIRTDRGLETGEVLCQATESSVESLDEVFQGQILREMSRNDANEVTRIHEQQPNQLDICQKSIDKLGLEMQLVDIEHIFGGERIVVYYLADGRVDFRELVRVLAGEFQTRIEMRQIGVRDEAKLMADYGDCGKAVCCNTHLVQMPPVSMKMAKLQKATLDPTKISGRCGRLKCCLRYEYDVYEQLQKELPPIGSTVESEEGPVKVVGQEILAQAVIVEFDDKLRKLLHTDEIGKVITVEEQIEDQQNETTSDTDNQTHLQ
ncbi:MAG: signal peptidase [Pirellulales bacterium]|nr:signal peptidase [Pirellulales bacterium]